MHRALQVYSGLKGGARLSLSEIPLAAFHDLIKFSI